MSIWARMKLMNDYELDTKLPQRIESYVKCLVLSQKSVACICTWPGSVRNRYCIGTRTLIVYLEHLNIINNYFQHTYLPNYNQVFPAYAVSRYFNSLPHCPLMTLPLSTWLFRWYLSPYAHIILQFILFIH